MQKLNRSLVKKHAQYPEKVLQFGEGNFIRGFVDWQIHELNEHTDFNGSVVVVQPRASTKIARLNSQEGLFTLYLQGIKDGKPVNEHQVITSISRGIDLSNDYNEYKMLARKEELRFIVSNTTEAGIVFIPEDRFEDAPPNGFPGKLTAFLYERFQAFLGDTEYGCVIIPCELIENNGEKLREIVLQYAKHWDLGEKFIHWICSANTFCSSLVDRIVPGFPKDSYEEKVRELGFKDELMVVGEPYHLWVIEGPEWLKQELPIEGTGLNIHIVQDLTPYRTRKVRILNGAHTAMTPIAYLSGLNTVEEAVNHEEIGLFVRKLIEEEIIPTLEGEKSELMHYMNEVMNRFANPYIKHYLMSISLNSISKFQTRNLPSLLEFIETNQYLPKRMVFAWSCLLFFYRGKRGNDEINLQDESNVLQFLQTQWEKYDNREWEMRDVSKVILSEPLLWGRDLSSIPTLVEEVSANLLAIEQIGVLGALKDLYETSI
jgi:tagaturonate reductase